MKLTSIATALALAAASPAARASVWDQAILAEPSDEDVEAQYDEMMDDGDQATRLVAGQSMSKSRALDLVMLAARSYEKAAALRPDRAEPHWRAAMVLYTMMIDCPSPAQNTILCDSRSSMDARVAKRVIEHWDEVERLEPLDPRLKTIYFTRAILNTKLATDATLAAARDDYEKFLAYGDSLQLDGASGILFGNRGQTLGNLAETYMMLGDLDMAITRYQDAVLVNSGTSMLYGLAIAYDRDEQGAKAREIIRALGEDAAESWALEVERGDTFYVPDGEVWYYKALIAESLGHDKDALAAWKRFIDSGAHSIYQPRAQHHLDALKAKLLGQAAQKLP